MDPEEIRQQLSTLTPREREVLGLYCQGLEYWQIADRLFLSEGGVRSHMSNLSKKLNLSSYTRGPRRQLLLDEYCPVLQAGGLDAAFEDVEEEDEPESPLSPEEEALVDELQYALVPVDPIVIEPIRDTNGGRGCRRSLILILGGLVGGAVLTVVLLMVFGTVDLPGASTEATPTLTEVVQAAEAQAPTDTIPPTETTQPTSEPSATLEPSATSTPPRPTQTPFPLPFTDNFNNGASPEWEVLAGNWRMVDGTYTANRRQAYDWNVSLIGGESWQDYVLEVDAITDNWNWPVRVIVRANQGTYLFFETNCCETKLILIEGGEETEVAHSETGGLTGSIFWHTNHLRIESSNNIFTIYSDGIKLLTAQDNTLPSGKVGLSLDYEARFDNFEIRDDQ